MEPATEAQRQRVAERARLSLPVQHPAPHRRAPVELPAQCLAEQGGEGGSELCAESGLFREARPDFRFGRQIQALSVAPSFAAAATIRAAIACSSSSVKLFSCGCRLTSTASDFCPSGTL